MKIKYCWLFLILHLFFCSIDAQQFSTRSKKAIKLYQEAYQIIGTRAPDYEKGIALMQKAVSVDNRFIEAYLVLADLHIQMKDPLAAIDDYRNAVAINPDFFPQAMYNLANLEYEVGDYENAKTHLESFIIGGKGDMEYMARAGKLMKNCGFAVDAISHPVPFHPVNLGDSVNSVFDEYWPSLSADENTLVITVLLPKNPNNPQVYLNRQEDFYICQRSNDSLWGERKPVSALVNTIDNEGAQTLSADGKIMIFTACNRSDGIGGCDLYASYYKNEEWTVPVNLGLPVNTQGKESQPSISPDGKTIYFASNRAGGKGNMDIWKTTLGDQGFWTIPDNLGDSINTPGEEQSPFIHPDNRTLYFSSDSWPGMGKSDIFITRLNASGQWKQPENLGYPINTNGQEIGLFVNALGNRAYYSSDRIKERGKDIYRFELHEEARPLMVSYMKGKVFDKETNGHLEAKVEIIDLTSAKTVNEARSEEDNGEFLVCIPTDKDYAINVNRKGYLFYSDNFSIHGTHDISEPYLKDIPLQPIKQGERIVLKNIFYETDSYKLKPESEAELSKIVEFMNSNPDLTVEISGHTDNVGSPQYNKQLSENRAKSVVNYLLKHTISNEHITFKGYGETLPIANNDTEKGRAQNRRTELKIAGN